MRLFGHGRVLRVNSPEYEAVFEAQYSPENCDIYNARGIRAIILIDVFKVGTSCGWGVPFFEYKGPRETLQRLSGKRTEEQMAGFWAQLNTTSLDGLPGMRHERMGPEWATLSNEDQKKLKKFMTALSGGPVWWNLRYLVENVSLVAVGAGIGTVVGAAAAILFMAKRG